MSLQSIPTGAGQGGANGGELVAAVKELQGFNLSIGTGAASGTKVNVAGIRSEDTILSVIRSVAGVLTDVTANYSIVDTHASGTLTLSGVVDGDTCVVNGVTYTAKTTPTASNHFAVGGSNALTAANLAAAINAHQVKFGGLGFGTKTVTASANSAVVTITAVVDGTAGNSITTVGSTHITASGATLSGGTATGGVKSNADHSATSSLIIAWYNKNA